jgi:hypothetical protein
MRLFTFLCIPLLLLVTACASAPTAQRALPSILDVLDQPSAEAQAVPISSKDCPVGTVAMCVAGTRAGLRSNCACVNSADAMNAFGGVTRY